MRSSYEKLSARDSQNPGGRPSLKLVAVLAVGLIVGMFVGSSLGRSTDDPVTTEQTTVADGVPTGFERTCEGAALASGKFFQVMQTPEVALDAEASRAAIDRMATGAVATEMKAAVTHLVEPYAAGAIGQEYRAGAQTLQVGVPVAYKIRSCEKDRVVVRLWTVTVRGNATNVWPMQFWRTVETELHWVGGEWQILDGWNRDGPIPYWTQRPLPSRSANQALVMRITREMKSFATLP